MPSFLVSQLWPVLSVLCQRGESRDFARILSTSLSFSPFPSNHHAETEEQTACPSCCGTLVGVTVSAGKEGLCCPFLLLLPGWGTSLLLVDGWMSSPHIIMASGAYHLCTRWFLKQFSQVLSDSYYLDFLVHLSLACLTELCKAGGMSRALCSWKRVIFLELLMKRGLGGISESFITQLLCSLNWMPVQILNCFLN